MSFRKKNREAEGEDVKVSREKEQSSKQQPSQAEQQPEPEQQPESTPPQSDESSDEQSTSDDEEDDDSEPVPDGTTAEILRWVDGDKDKARRALAQEEADESPRKGLTSELHRVLDGE